MHSHNVAFCPDFPASGTASLRYRLVRLRARMHARIMACSMRFPKK